MSWSLGEAKALATKAARGAGLSWGMAEEAGFAIYWLQSQGAPGIRALATYLDWRDTATNALGLCPLSIGSALMDARRGIPAALGRVRQPLLLAPFMAATTPSGVKLSWGDVHLIVSERGLLTEASPEALLALEADCTARQTTATPTAPHTRVPQTEAASLTALQFYAARTYAPATDASRDSGAGAGTTDND